MDAFYAAVEQRDRPELRGRPLIVGGSARRGVVSTASYEARVFGVHSAMPMARALDICPDAAVVSPDFEAYEEASSRIMEVFSRYSPLVEPLSLDEAFIDMSGATGLFGQPGEIAAAIKRDVLEATALTVSVGVATTKYVAKVASDFEKPDGTTIVPPGEETAFLWPMPISRLWGVGEKTGARIAQMGLETIGDVARADRALMEERLGSLGEHLWLLANGLDDREVIPHRDAKSIGREYTLERDISGREAITVHLRRSADKVGRRLRSKGLEASGVRVKLKTAGFKLLTRQAPLRPPTDSTKAILSRAEGLLDNFNLDVPVRLVGLAVYDLAEAGGHQGELFVDGDAERARRLDRALDAVQDRFGEDALTRAEDDARRKRLTRTDE